MLTQEQEATNWHTMQHIARVRDLLGEFITELLQRGRLHDQSKLASPEVEGFTEYTPKLAKCTFGSPEYNEFKKAMAATLSHHYANNRHHPEFARRDEEWRPVVGFETSHEVSNYGAVRSLTRIVTRAKQGDFSKPGELLKQFLTPKGYCRLQLRAGKRCKNVMVHRLVAEAFIPNPDGKPEVNHKRGIKHDNRAEALEWATASENLQHSYDEGIRKGRPKYVVTCVDLDITTTGCSKMVTQLKRRGFTKASGSGVWNSVNCGCKHLGMVFIGTKLEEHKPSPLDDMTLVDLLEMLVDWKAASERHNDGNIRKSIEINAEQFQMSPQLTRIFENTAREYF